MIKDFDYYMSLDYDIALRELDESEGGGILAYYVDIPSIMGDGESKEEAIKDVKEAFKAYIKVSLKHKDRIIEPKESGRSKRINVTIPNDLLKKIDEFVKSHNTTRSAFLQQASRKILAG